MTMEHLSLPAFDFKLKEEDGTTMIFDQIRKKYIVLTPEEWVRQHFINYLIADLGYPKALLNVEQGLRYNSLLKRSDILVFSREGNPLLLVECKAAQHKLDQKVVDQAMTYNKTIKANYIVVTNGIESACLQIQTEEARLEYLAKIPSYVELE